MTWIQTNVLDGSVLTRTVRNRLAEKYMVVCAAFSGEVHNTSPMLDVRGSILAVYHEKGDRKAYYLMPAGPEKEEILNAELHEVLEKAGVPEGEIPRARREHMVDVPDVVLWNLLLCSLGGTGKGRSNLTGSLYQYVKAEGQTRMIAIQYRITKGLVLAQNAVSFTKKTAIPQQKRRKGPEYAYDSKTNTLTRVPYGTKGSYLKQRGDGGRAEVKFFGFPGRESFRRKPEDGARAYGRTRVAELFTLISEFNEKYSEFGLEIRLRKCRETGKVRTSSRELTEIYRRNREMLDRVMEGLEVEIRSTDEGMAGILGKVRETAQGLGFRLGEGGVKIVLIHSEDYYEDSEERDPHRDLLEAQHLTYERWLESEDEEKEDILWNCALNAVVKRDIRNGRVSLFDCSRLPWERMFFAEIFSRDSGEGEEEKPRKREILVLELCRSGALRIGRPEEFDEFDLVSAWGFFSENRTAEYCVQAGGAMNGVIHTEIRTMPEQEKMMELLKNPEFISRSEEAKDDFLAGITDLRSFELDGEEYYICGMEGRNMAASLPSAPNARKVVPLSGGRLLTGEMLPLLCVEFVRAGQLTVKPFPIKYLREYGEAFLNTEEADEEQYP